jgi:hypothetical protein
MSARDRNARERLENAFTVAEHEYGVTRLLDAEDIDVEQPDEKSIITYVSSLYDALPNLPEFGKVCVMDDLAQLCAFVPSVCPEA